MLQLPHRTEQSCCNKVRGMEIEGRGGSVVILLLWHMRWSSPEMARGGGGV